MTMTALIVDDEDLARAVIREHLAAHPEIQIVGECSNGFEAVKMVSELKPELLFLDIQMPKLNGFEVLELLDFQPSVIFVTAYDQHALKAFEVHAMDYLLKPFSRERFDQALAQAKEKRRNQVSPSVTPGQLAAAGKPWPLDRIVVKDGSKITLVPMAKLDYVQAQDDYVELRTEGKSLLKQQTLTALEAQLDPRRFIRIHRSYILNLDRLFRLEQGSTESWMAVLRDGTKLPVSKSGYARLKEYLGQN